jgi:hypothetical protein
VRYADIRGAFTTFAAHTRPGTLLVIVTQTDPIQTAKATTQQIDTPGLRGTVTVSYDWDPTSRINTMHRRWDLADGTHHRDTIHRRVLTLHQLAQHAARAGFEPVPLLDDTDGPGTPPTGSVGWFVARSTTT